jgi:hypothetical protein
MHMSEAEPVMTTDSLPRHTMDDLQRVQDVEQGTRSVIYMDAVPLVAWQRRRVASVTPHPQANRLDGVYDAVRGHGQYDYRGPIRSLGEALNSMPIIEVALRNRVSELSGDFHRRWLEATTDEVRGLTEFVRSSTISLWVVCVESGRDVSDDTDDGCVAQLAGFCVSASMGYPKPVPVLWNRANDRQGLQPANTSISGPYLPWLEA